MRHPGLAERLIIELAAARAAIMDSYERLWPRAERIARTAERRDPGVEPSTAADRRTDEDVPHH